MAKAKKCGCKGFRAVHHTNIKKKPGKKQKGKGPIAGILGQVLGQLLPF